MRVRLQEGKNSSLVFSKHEEVKSLDDFTIKAQIGRGTFGKASINIDINKEFNQQVFLGVLKSTGKLYAIKSIRKDVLLDADLVDSTLLEKNILLACDHPFLAGMDFIFQNEARIYFVLQFI